MSLEGRFIAAVTEAWHASPNEMSDPGIARLRDPLTIALEERGMAVDGRLTSRGRQAIAELRRERTSLVKAFERAGGNQ